MATRKARLELTWIGKQARKRIEPRILIKDLEQSYRSSNKTNDNVINDNILVFGDNLLALKALEKDFTGKVRCIYIDPPYNSGSAFKSFDDGVEHSIWLTLMRDRLEILRDLLTFDGSIFLSIDDNEGHYLKILCDEVMGRNNFVASFVWKKVDSPNDNKVPITPDHEYVLCYTKVPGAGRFKQQPDQSILGAYRAPDSESDLYYRDRLLKKNGKNSLRADRPSMYFPVKAPDGEDVYPTHDDGREACWAMGKAAVDKLVNSGEMIWKERSSGWTPYVREYAPAAPSRPYPTIWGDVLTTRQAKSHQKRLLGADDVFDTPKPEPLIQRILNMATDPGDIVLDSFAGSGTTGAVAHKMGRRWIMVELRPHCLTHIVPRLKKVIDGNDQGGISVDVELIFEIKLSLKILSNMDSLLDEVQLAEDEVAGRYRKIQRKVEDSHLRSYGLLDSAAGCTGGGFNFFRLAPSLLRRDKWNNWVVSKDYNPEMLAEAVCKLEGFGYEPAPEVFWNHGRSTETDFIYVTTQNLSHDQLQFISDQVGSERTLLICCGAFRAKRNDFENLTLKKIPQAVLSRCEWDRDDYSLNIEPQPSKQAAEEIAADSNLAKVSDAQATTGKKKASKKKAVSKRRAISPAGMQELPLVADPDGDSN